MHNSVLHMRKIKQQFSSLTNLLEGQPSMKKINHSSYSLAGDKAQAFLIAASPACGSGFFFSAPKKKHSGSVSIYLCLRRLRDSCLALLPTAALAPALSLGAIFGTTQRGS